MLHPLLPKRLIMSCCHPLGRASHVAIAPPKFELHTDTHRLLRRLHSRSQNHPTKTMPAFSTHQPQTHVSVRATMKTLKVTDYDRFTLTLNQRLMIRRLDLRLPPTHTARIPDEVLTQGRVRLHRLCGWIVMAGSSSGTGVLATRLEILTSDGCTGR